MPHSTRLPIPCPDCPRGDIRELLNADKPGYTVSYCQHCGLDWIDYLEEVNGAPYRSPRNIPTEISREVIFEESLEISAEKWRELLDIVAVSPDDTFEKYGCKIYRAETFRNGNRGDLVSHSATFGGK